MKFVPKPKPVRPQYCDTRTITRFAWIPIWCKNDGSWRWLERVSVLQIYRKGWYMCGSGESKPDRWETIMVTPIPKINTGVINHDE